ncbi:hypothetical protein CXG50_12390 [Pseudomonas plecoglossicida]|uniref:hypothetical protein n=1 Tax=Pseudomonas putida group TaxID=136845 RepID=UPI000C7C19E1|nr:MULTISPECIES: hypothetical protein [Pseudomonas putida group]MDD2027110.1 hypothetical protein [Pseudomonas putida]PLU99940.1 hypothetical protein CXG52_06855 [Pseudomonas plecoglossicida]PLV09200.1 hypothetical protein CXG50_12390 [Pseudomonas plecoglossicida]HDS1765629.1 hypothetical protein [Pseudomonas putida]
MRYNTGNSVGADGSSSPFDLHDNSGNIDVWANDRSRLTWPDRLGVERKTFFGMEQQVTDFLIDMGYESVYLVYGTGIVVARQTQLVQRDGELYRVMNASDIPLTLTGTWATDAPKLQSVGDAALRQALSTDAGAYLSGYKGKTVGAVLDGLQVQVKLPTSTSDSSLDLAAALALSNNVVFPESTLPYVFKTQVAPILTKDTKIDFNGQLCQFNGGRLSLKAETVATGRTLNANAARYAFQISMGDTSGLQQGDILFINTSISPSTEWSDTKKDCVTVKGVTGNLVDLFEPLNFHYTTADSGLSITVYRAKELELINPNLLLIAADNDTTSKVMIDVYGMRGVEIRSPTIKGQRPFSRSTNIYRTGIQVLACIDTNITNAKSESMSYPLGAYFASRGIRERDTEGKYNHHTNVDCGDWASDYSLDGMVSSDSYQSLNTHPVLRAYARNFQINNDFGLSTWRCIGGGLSDGVINSLEGDAAEIAQYQNAPMSAAYKYLYDDADLYFDNVDYRVPNRITKAPVAVRFGRNVSVCNSKMSDFWVSFAARDDVKTLIVGAGNRFGAAWSRTPKKDNILTTTRIDVDCPLDADLISGVYHINPREKMVPHSKGRLACRGAVDSNQSGAATFTASLRIHVNAFSDSDQANVILGKLKLFATVFHQNAGRFSTQEKHFNFEFDVQATSAVNAPLVATYTSGLSGQTNESVSIAIGAPSFAGVSQIGTSVDHYIEFPVTVSSGRTSPVYSLTYDLEMIRAA